MHNFLENLNTADLFALAVFVSVWFLLEFVLDHSSWRHKSLSGLMSHKRREWMLVLAERELRIVDASLLGSLQQGAAFFASSTVLAIGGCFALLGSTEIVLEIYSELPIGNEVNQAEWHIKVLGLALIFVYSFFKFGWSYRLFNYCAILIGAVQQPHEAESAVRRAQALKAGEMNIVASRHFTAGLRGIFFALAYLGWFIGPYAFMMSTCLVVLVLIRRQYFSRARQLLLD